MALRSASLALLAMVCAPAAAVASPISVSVLVDTSPLIGHAAAPFFLNFQLNDGTGVGNANNTALLTGFDFGGGAAAGAPSLLGGASGDLASTVTLVDSAFLNAFTQEFIPGIALTFQLSLTGFVEPGAPDQFSLAILDNSGFELPSTGPFGAAIVIDITDPVIAQTFATDASIAPIGGGTPIDMAAPQLVAVEAVPEPGTLLLVGPALLGFASKRIRRKLRPGV